MVGAPASSGGGGSQGPILAGRSESAESSCSLRSGLTLMQSKKKRLKTIIGYERMFKCLFYSVCLVTPLN